MFFFYIIFFTYNIYNDKNTFKLKKRLERLLIPYLLWPLIIFVIVNIFSKTKISLYHLRNQLICRYQFLIALWHLLSIILLSILFFFISILFPKLFLFIIQLLSIFSYIFQYSGFYHLLDIYKKNFKMPILHTISIIPLSALGLIFASLKIVDILEKKRKVTLFFSYLFIYF